jgi:hypothetical protein
LKRLAEIVSAQAIAQQEKLEYPDEEEDGGADADDVVDDVNDLSDSEMATANGA